MEHDGNGSQRFKPVDHMQYCMIYGYILSIACDGAVAYHQCPYISPNM